MNPFQEYFANLIPGTLLIRRESGRIYVKCARQMGYNIGRDFVFCATDGYLAHINELVEISVMTVERFLEGFEVREPEAPAPTGPPEPVATIVRTEWQAGFGDNLGVWHTNYSTPHALGQVIERDTAKGIRLESVVRLETTSVDVLQDFLPFVRSTSPNPEV